MSQNAPTQLEIHFYTLRGTPREKQTSDLPMLDGMGQRAMLSQNGYISLSSILSCEVA